MIRLIQINERIQEFGIRGPKRLALENVLDLQGYNTIRVVGDGRIRVEIKCFVHKPPPPSFQPCPECGSLILESNETKQFLKDIPGIQRQTDRLNIQIIDEENDIIRITLSIPQINFRYE
ncbi:hypothetical protein KDU71_03805 [Carboxylicivirga sediminis]|uniref:Uncharacterized protein n=1 Tax=Carboxylicivirga sediminis TaxID=2006564 RepID=A0A941IXG8_9BACT|nr:hypothetical protein [Carboxylicivirga sediminis]MBR8534672.1 hypothetical protein [Carboxylicivirga sediminis]